MSYTHLSEHERYVISHLQYSFSIREIARRLGRNHSTISREIKRAKARHPWTIYYYDWTQPLALERRHKPRHFRRQNNSRLVSYVELKLKLEWSPEEIANRIRMDYPTDDTMRISHETIYRWIYLEGSVGGVLYQRLRRKHKKRRKQRRYGVGYRFRVDRISIDQRPGIVANRSRFGDWEGDTVQGKPGSGCIATMVERKSRYLVAVKLDNKKAATLTQRCVKAFGPIPRRMRQSLTLDNGSEFANFKELEKKTRLSIYFADPYAAWQRGANENTNGLLRQYFSKGIDFRKTDEIAVTEAVRKLNNRPRKCLGYRTPNEVFWSAARGALAI
nr:IS30 family transposase [uncultured Desulfuromonas sp.]